MNTPTQRQRLLAHATEITSHDRNSSYGEPEDSFAPIAAYWSVLFGIPVSSAQVCQAMVLLKVARITTGDPTHFDSWVDIAGYAACGWDTVAPPLTNVAGDDLVEDAQLGLFAIPEDARLSTSG